MKAQTVGIKTTHCNIFNAKLIEVSVLFLIFCMCGRENGTILNGIKPLPLLNEIGAIGRWRLCRSFLLLRTTQGGQLLVRLVFQKTFLTAP